MKHFTLAIVCLAASATAATGAPTLTNSKALDVKAEFVNNVVTTSKTISTEPIRHQSDTAITLTLPEGAVAPAKAPAMTADVDDLTWNSLGNVSLTEPCLCDWNMLEEPFTVQCEIQEAAENPGYFRLVDPYQAVKNAVGGIYDDSTPHYMYINATNPDAVYIEYFETGYTPIAAYGQLKFNSYAYYYLANGYSLATIANAGLCGTYANGAITFPTNTLLSGLANYNKGALYEVKNDYFRVAFPGAKDYSISLTAPGCAKDNKIYWTFNFGADIATATYFLVDGEWEDPEQYFEYVANSALAKDYIVPGPGTYSFNLATAPAGRYTLFVGGFDEDGNYKGGACTFFYAVNFSDEGWEKVGDVKYGDVFIGSQYRIGYTEYEVELQENTDYPGYYRIANPYTENFSGAANNTHTTDHNHYIYIDATNPEAIVLEEGPIGSNWGYGDMFVSSNAARDQKDFGAIASYDDFYKRITFPAGSLLFSEQAYEYGAWQTCVSADGDFFIEIPKIVIADKDVIEEADVIIELPEEIFANDALELPATSTIGTAITYSIENMVVADEDEPIEEPLRTKVTSGVMAELVTDEATGAVSLVIYKSGELDLVATMAGNDDYAPKTLTQHMVFSDIATGIGAIEIDTNNGAVKYYDLNGRRVINPAKGQVVISVNGKAATKVIAE